MHLPTQIEISQGIAEPSAMASEITYIAQTQNSQILISINELYYSDSSSVKLPGAHHLPDLVNMLESKLENVFKHRCAC
jgi:hypothetical protein